MLRSVTRRVGIHYRDPSRLDDSERRANGDRLRHAAHHLVGRPAVRHAGPAELPELPAEVRWPEHQWDAHRWQQFLRRRPVVDAVISQTVDLSAASAAIDTGTVGYNLSAWLGGYTLDPSAASVKVTFLDAGGNSLGSDKLRKVGLLDRFFATKFKERTATGLLPVDTRSAVVEVTFNDKNPIIYGLNARYNDAFADNISFTVDAALSAPMVDPPVSTVGALDHVFMVYMENKGLQRHRRQQECAIPEQPDRAVRVRRQLLRADPWQPAELLPDRRRLELWDHLHCASPCIYTTNLLTTNLDNMYGANGWRAMRRAWSRELIPWSTAVTTAMTSFRSRRSRRLPVTSPTPRRISSPLSRWRST